MRGRPPATGPKRGSPLAQSAATQAESAFGARNADPMAVRRNSTAIISDGAVLDNDDAAHESLERAAVSLPRIASRNRPVVPRRTRITAPPTSAQIEEASRKK